MRRHSSRHLVRAFTLIELLTVIAIIAVLAAILFPIFGTVREQTRQSSTLSKMHSIYLGARLFYEDEGRFPPSLYGYAEVPLSSTWINGSNGSGGHPTGPYARPAMTSDPTNTITPMDKATGSYSTGNGLIRGYLFGEQIKDYVTFLDDDNIGHTNQAVTEVYWPPNSPQGAGGNTLVTWRAATAPGADGCPLYADIDFPCTEAEATAGGACSAYNGVPKLYYINDSMDIGPMIDPITGKQAKDNSGNLKYELHYTPNWTGELYNDSGYTGSGTNPCDLGANGKPYTTQLKYKNPPSESTIISWNTQHVVTANSPNTLILLASGTARKINYNDGLKWLPLEYNR
jgi:prepilin-type N-terminal cleavage/methylation domain-containing protein